MGFFDIKKRGQFTIFVILGFVLLVIVLSTMFMVSFMGRSNFQSAANKAAADYLESNVINYYVYTCIDSVVKDVVNTMTIQGGVAWDDRSTIGIDKTEGQHIAETPGVTHIPMKYSFNENDLSEITKFNLSYGIIDQPMCPDVTFEAPDYPFAETKIDDLQTKYNSYEICRFVNKYRQSGALGFNDLSKLCYPGSPNYKTDGSQTLISPCVNNFQTDKFSSIEVELADQINRGIADCVHGFDVYKEEGHEITLAQGTTPKAKVTFNAESFNLDVTYDFEVKLKGKEPVIASKVFEYKSDLRLTKVHNYILNLLTQESRDPYFKIAEDYASVLGYDSNMEVSYHKASEFSDCEACKYDHVLLVKDNLSKINDRPMHFFVGIKNRKPVLDFIHQSAAGSLFNIVVIEDQMIKIVPEAIDPDDEPVFYDYSGWKQTTNQEFDFTNCNIPVLSLDELLSGNCIKNINPPNLVDTWKNSAPFTKTLKDAQYLTQHEDTGPHKTIVKTVDEGGLEDYQVVDILVVDTPQIKAAVNSEVDMGLPPNIMSVEDTFILDHAGTTPPILAGLIGLTTESLKWKVYEKDGGTLLGPIWEKDILDFNNPNTKTYFPGKEDFVPEGRNIQTIHEAKLKKPGDYKISLEMSLNVENPGQDALPPFEEGIDVKVFQCIPFKNSPEKGTYPYGGITSVDFSGDHGCCAGTMPTDPTDLTFINTANFELQPTNTVCFEDTWYGELEDLKVRAQDLEYEDKLSAYYSTIAETNIAPDFTGSTSSNLNDIYIMEYKRFCDGHRGNICAGKMRAVISEYKNCYDNTQFPDQCSGPLTNPTQTAPNPLSGCYSYGPGVSFEEAFNKPDATGICNMAYAASTMGVIGGYGDGGPAKCKASCANGGCNYAQYNPDRPQDCQCDKSAPYNAECVKDEVEWSGTFCRSDCDYEGSCTFKKNTNVYCQSGETSCLGSDNYCHFNVACQEGTSGPVIASPTKDLCIRGERTEPFLGVNVRFCYWGDITNACTASGTCKLTGDPITFSCPISGGTCNPDTGWECNGLI